MSQETERRRTPLYDVHNELGARMAPFGDWEMPIRYGGILQEARAVRSGAGLFDVSHMGRVEIDGPGATELLESALSVSVMNMNNGRARYNLLCDESGGIIDDCIVYRLSAEKFLLVPNASNTRAALEWLGSISSRNGSVSIVEVTASTAMIACQGPDAIGMAQRLSADDLRRIRPFRATSTTIAGVDARIARTGYTGEDGFEIMPRAEDAPTIWRALMELGAVSCGLGARDVLRLEAGLLLHGSDMDRTTNPYEAGLGRFVEPDRDEYIAGDALRRIRDDGPTRRIAGFTMLDRGIPRADYPILKDGETVGSVTSGSPSPTLDMNIGLGYVPIALAEPGTRIDIQIRGRPVGARIAAIPFYRRQRRERTTRSA